MEQIQTEAPDGFTSLRRPKVEAFFKVEKGATIQGVLIGRFTSNKPDPKSGKFKSYYHIKLTRPSKAQVKVGKEYVTKKIDVGDMVSIDESAALKPWAELVTDGRKHEVYARVIGKKSIGGGQSFWEMDIAHKPL